MSADAGLLQASPILGENWDKEENKKNFAARRDLESNTALFCSLLFLSFFLALALQTSWLLVRNKDKKGEDFSWKRKQKKSSNWIGWPQLAS